MEDEIISLLDELDRLETALKTKEEELEASAGAMRRKRRRSRRK